MSSVAAAVRPSRSRRLLPWVLLACAVLVTAGAGVWGGIQPREGGHGHGEEHASRPTDSVPVPGGLLRVERVDNVGLAHRMPGMDYDPVPAGYRRINIQVTLVARSEAGLRVTPESFELRGERIAPHSPVRHQLRPTVLRQGSSVTGALTFQIPEKAEHLELGMRGGSGSVSITAPHGDTGHAQEAGHGHGQEAGHTRPKKERTGRRRSPMRSSSREERSTPRPERR